MCSRDVRWFWGTDVCLARTAQRRTGGSWEARALERQWANSKRKGRTNRVYIWSLGTLPPTLVKSKVNLQLIRTWGYTGKEVKINPLHPQPLLHVHLLFLHWCFHELSSLHLLCVFCPCLCFLSRWPTFQTACGTKRLCLGFKWKSLFNSVLLFHRFVNSVKLLSDITDNRAKLRWNYDKRLG